MYDDSPNFQIQIKELGSRERWKELQDLLQNPKPKAALFLTRPSLWGSGFRL